MKKLFGLFVFVFALFAFSGNASSQPGGVGGSADPFFTLDQDQTNYICNGSWNCNSPYNDKAGKTVQTAAINNGVANLVYFVLGQSNNESEAPSAYSPTNGSKIDNFNYLDGQLYVAADPQLGTSWNTTGSGTMAFAIADTLITNGKFARVILVPLAVGGSSINQWGTGTGFNSLGNASLYNVVCVAIARLKAKGIVQGVNVTFAIDFGQGETDGGSGTSQADYQANLSQMISHVQSCGFVGRIFIKLESWAGSATSAAVRAAQTAVVDNVTVFQGADVDTIPNAQRVDTIHLNNAGVAAAAALQVTALHASGVPFLYQSPFAANDNWQALEGCNDNTRDLCKAM